MQSPLSGLSAIDRLRQRLEKDIEESEAAENQSFQTVLQNIETATQRLLAQPSRRETLQADFEADVVRNGVIDGDLAGRPVADMEWLLAGDLSGSVVLS